MNKVFSILLILISFSKISAQQSTNFGSPLDIPLILSGNFGELRGDHFHSGIDIKTQGVSGQKVRAVESGYVSRIKVQGGGYGKALYIAHPNGYTSVYGHLSSYNTNITAYVKRQQYANQSHEIDIYLKPGDIPVDKGDILAFSGNTGSSAGPHLHFEIRTTKNQFPQNVLFYGFPVKDDISPSIRNIAIYPVGNNSMVAQSSEKKIFKTVFSANRYKFEKDEAISVWGEIGFGLEVYDYLNGARNRCGIFSLELKVDGERYFYSEMDQFSFSNSRFINAHIDYEAKVKEGLNIQRLYKLPYNNLKIYKQLNQTGTINITDTLEHIVNICAIDTYGNKSDASFKIKGKKPSILYRQKNTDGRPVIHFDTQTSFVDKDIKISIPAYSLYKDASLSYLRTSGREDLLSDIFQIGDIEIPLHKSYLLSLNYTPDEGIDRKKLCLVSIDNEGEIRYVGGDFSNGNMDVSLRYFGKFAISIDTLAPKIIPRNISSGVDMGAEKQISFTVSDNLSGIARYDGYIDSEWVLFEFDPKNEHIFYEFDDNVLNSGKIHELELYLIDSKGNKAIYHTTFYR